MLPTTPMQLVDLQADAAGVANNFVDNILVVGATTAPSLTNLLTHTPDPAALEESEFSESNSHVKAVGERMFNTDEQGTSYAAPQVAGLASYLWLLSPQLRSLPPSVTAQAIIANAQTAGSGSGLIDAYATVLSLDQAGSPGNQLTPAQAPIRLAILDVNGNVAFDDDDLNQFVRHYYLVDANGNLTGVQNTPTNVDFGRFDLNGDGFTGGSGIAAFDLDRAQSKQFGATVYSSDVAQNIEGQTIHFNSEFLTDLQVLCYYAYSPLYTGSPDARESVLSGRCGGFSISPKKISLHPGDTFTFTATAKATFSVSGGGSMDPTSGLFTAGNTPGTYTVTANDANDTSLSDTATVTVLSNGPLLSGTLFISSHYYNGPVDNPIEKIDDDLSADVTVAVAANGVLSVQTVMGSVSFTSVGLNVPCLQNGTPTTYNPPGETLNITLDSGYFPSNTLTPVLVLTGSGTATGYSEPPDGSCTTVATTYNLAEGQASYRFIGTAVYTNGKLTEIDFTNDLPGNAPSGSLKLVQ